MAILTVAAEADFDAILQTLGPEHDPIRIASLFLGAQPFIPPREWQPVIQKLLTLDDDLSREIVIGLLSRWIELTVTQGGMEDINRLLGELEKSGSQGPVILARSWKQYSVFYKDASRRRLPNAPRRFRK